MFHLTQHNLLLLNMLDGPTVTAFYQEIAVQLQSVLAPYGELGEISFLGKPKPVADDTTKLLVHNRKKQPIAVILCSSPVSPYLVAQSINKAEQARLLLSPELHKVIPVPLMSGTFRDLTYVVLPYYEPLSSSYFQLRLQRWLIRQKVLAWLREVIQFTMRTPSQTELEVDFIIPLEKIMTYQFQHTHIKQTAIAAIHRINTGQWVPRYVLAHNDFWEGNLLLYSDNLFGFMVIDWGSANIKGYAIYDLLRIADSFNLKHKTLFKELQQHCHLLACSTEDTQGYLLASLGYLGMHLECFPQERYMTLVETLYDLLHYTLTTGLNQ